MENHKFTVNEKIQGHSDSISLPDLISYAQSLPRGNLLNSFPDSSQYRLLGLLQGSQYILHSPPPRIKSPALLALLQKCQNTLDQQSYNQMVRSSLPREHLSYKQTVGQLSSIANILLSMISVFVACMFVGDQLSLSLPLVRVFFCSLFPRKYWYPSVVHGLLGSQKDTFSSRIWFCSTMERARHDVKRTRSSFIFYRHPKCLP